MDEEGIEVEPAIDVAPQAVKDPGKSYECPLCDFVATGSDNTKLYEEAVKHKRSYHEDVGEQEFNCDECDYKSKDQGSLNRHKRTHKFVNPKTNAELSTTGDNLGH